MVICAVLTLILNKIRAFGSTDCFNASTDCYNGSTDCYNGSTDSYNASTDGYNGSTDCFTELTEQNNGFSGLISAFMAQYKRTKEQNFAPTEYVFVGAFLREG